jgi:ribonuclease HI|tara:strand:+ start:6995 stop:7501 length:507 start_codon:yes stop_codon:yes gene_type:complete
MNEIIVFTDGSTLNNQEKGNRRGGVGVFFGKDDERNISLSLKESHNFKVTNQVAELMASILAIEKILSNQKLKDKKIVIYTDSIYVKNIVNEWAEKWEKNNWIKSDKKAVDNIELVKKLYYLSKNVNVEFKHCRSHQKEPNKDDKNYYIWFGNNEADKLAVSAAQLIT